LPIFNPIYSGLLRWSKEWCICPQLLLEEATTASFMCNLSIVMQILANL
jgi:hypothetical protein